MMNQIVQNAVVEVISPASVNIQGRVDAFEGARILGWAWNSEQPTERLTIEAVLDGTVVATATADRTRIDLRRNGIGDGSHAFDLELPPELADSSGDVEVRIRAPSGETKTLRVPSTGELAAEAAVAVPLARVLEKLDVLVAAQRQLHIGQRDTATAMKDLTARLDTLCSEGGMIESTASHVASSHAGITERVSAIEVFLTRFDGTLGGFENRLVDLQAVGKHEIKPLVLLLSVISGFVAGAIIVMIAS